MQSINDVVVGGTVKVATKGKVYSGKVIDKRKNYLELSMNNQYITILLVDIRYIEIIED